MASDKEGPFLVAGWGGRTVFRIDVNGCNQQTLMTEWEGKKLNSPNDIVGTHPLGQVLQQVS